MKIGLCYDTKEDYGINPNNMEYTDFATLSTVSDISSALSRAGHSVKFINGINDLKRMVFHGLLPDVDMVFNIAEGIGSRNREALVPSLLEIYGIPYSGSDAYAMSLTLNKYHTKILAKHLGIPTPHGFILSSLEETDKVDINYPLIIKPNYEGGSMGVKLVKSLDELKQEAKDLWVKYPGEILCEQYIEGTEATVPIIGNGASAKALCVVTAKHASGEDIQIYTSELKYFGDIQLDVIQDAESPLYQQLLDYSRKMHMFLNLRDYSRFDYRIDKKGIPFLLEINPMPSLDRDDTFEVYAKSIGLEYYQIIDRIVREAASRNGINY